MMKEDARPRPARRSGRFSSRLSPEMRARAEELERKLGHPLRLDIEGPLTDDESEEVILARLMDDKWLPASQFLEEFKHLRGKSAQ